MNTDAFIILSPGFPAAETDCSCLPSLSLFVRQMKEQSPHLNIIVLAFQYPFKAGEYDWHGCKVIALGGKGRAKFFRLLLWWKVWKKLIRTKEAQRITGLLSFWCGEAALIGHRFGKKFGIPHHCWLLGQDAKKENHYVRRVRPLANELIAISDFVQAEFNTNHDILPGHIIPIGIDPTGFPAQKMPRDIDILGAGSLIPLKRYEWFVDIVAQLKRDRPDIKTVLCGKGPEEQKLKQLIKDHGLENNITLTGELPHSMVLQYMKRARLFLHTSVYEGFSAVCIEALFAGSPVISFCKPMNEAIPEWHIVQTKENMLGKAKEILIDPHAAWLPVLPFTIQVNVNKMMCLYGYNEVTSC